MGLKTLFCQKLLKKIVYCDTIYRGEFETFLTYALCAEKTKLKEQKVNRKNNAALYLTRGALVGALYVALTYLSSVFGLSSGVIQFRISEALCILPVFFPEASIGLFVGCIISNIFASGVLPLDIIFGSLATLIGAFGAYFLRKLPKKLMWLATLPTIIANALIIPFILIFAYGAEGGYFFFMLTVGIGEIVCAGIGGTVLYYSLIKTKLFGK